VSELPPESVDETLGCATRPVYQVVEHDNSRQSWHEYLYSELILLNKNAMALRSVTGEVSLFVRIDIDRVFLAAQSLGAR